MQINIIYDALAQAAPQSFKDGIQAAVNFLDTTFSNNISLNVEVGYGEYPGDGSAEPAGGASSGPSTGVFDSYSQVRSWLQGNADAAVQAGISTLPQATSIQGETQVAVWRAQEKLMGQVAPTDTGLDGYAGFGTNIPTASLEGVAIHELTHAMGRINYGPQPDIFDLYRFSGQGTRSFAAGFTSNPSYFSLDGGQTDLADYGQASDASDFLNASGRTPNDPLNEYYDGSTAQALTPVDLLQMESLGYKVAQATQPPAPPPPPASFLMTDTTTNVSSTPGGAAYVGPVAGITTDFITVTTDNLAISAQVPNVFIHTGSGDDAIKVLSGRNVLDGGTGSNFMTAGTGQDTFFVDDRSAPSDIWSTVVGAHTGDDVTVFGITRADFAISFVDGQGAPGATGLTMHASATGKPNASFTLAGFTTADLASGRVVVAFGANGTEPYMNVRIT